MTSVLMQSHGRGVLVRRAVGEEGVSRTRIFLSSPGDVGEERRLALAAIERVPGWYRCHVELDTVWWEREPLPAPRPSADRRVGVPHRPDAATLARTVAAVVVLRNKKA